jgi:hypothetical protein
MLKERLFNIIIYLFFGILFIYIINKPPVVVIKYPSIDSMANVIYN